jgi:hypothetical protein
VAKLADALDLGSSTVRCEGSSPFIRILNLFLRGNYKPGILHNTGFLAPLTILNKTTIECGVKKINHIHAVRILCRVEHIRAVRVLCRVGRVGSHKGLANK